MNVDELEPGCELDASIAEKVMGWSIAVDYDYHPPQINWCERGEFRALVNCPQQLKVLPTWSPSTDIAAAWLVVEKLREGGFGFDLFDRPRGWRAVVLNRHEKREIVADAETA